MRACRAVMNLPNSDDKEIATTLLCWLEDTHAGPHWDDVDKLYWLAPEPDVAQRIAEVFAEARAELDREA